MAAIAAASSFLARRIAIAVTTSRCARSSADPTSRPTTSHGAAGAIRCGATSAVHADPSALVFPEPVATPVKPHDPAVRESVGDLRAGSVARGTPDHADRRIGRDVPCRRRGPPGLRRQRRDDARQGAGVHPLTDHPGDVLFIHVLFTSLYRWSR